MERKECANGLQLIKIAAIKLKGKFSAAFVGALAMTTPLILCLFIGALMAILFNSGWVLTVGIVLFVIFVAPLQMGYMKYFNNLLDGKQPRISEVYSYLRFTPMTLRSVYISGLLILMYIIGGVLWMVPAGFAISFFSMTLFFLQKFEYERMTVAMKETAKKMVGNRLAMFSYKLIFYFIYLLLFILAGLFMLLVYTLLMDNFIISWIVAVCTAIVFIFLYTLVTVYFHSSNQIFFEDVLSRDEKKRQNKVHIDSNSTQQLTENKETKKNKTKNKNTEKKTVKKQETKKVSKKTENKAKAKETETSADVKSENAPEHISTENKGLQE